MNSTQILIVDFGSQYTQLIARRVRELQVYCEIYPYNKVINTPVLNQVKGIILSGSPCSVNDTDAPDLPLDQLWEKLPVLGICYGAQLLAQKLGGEVQNSETREYGRANLAIKDSADKLFQGISKTSQVWMSHGDTITSIPSELIITAQTHTIPVGAFRVKERETYGIQFHPEVTHTSEGKQLLSNFLFNICQCEPNWTPDSFVHATVQDLKEQLQDNQVVLGLSGGVDSSVAAMLLHQAIGKNLHCIFVDNGLLRKDEFAQVLDSYQNLGLSVSGVDAKSLFYKALAGTSDPELKRKAIGKTFIDVFQAEANKIENVHWLGQGTIYPDVIESVSVKGPSVTIKSHHNVGGLPEKMHLKVVEPLRMLFKDEVREVGKTLGLPENILQRHPFPGPGLAIRILGEITPERVKLLQEVDAIFIDLLHEKNLYHEVWQALAVLLPVQSVGVMGDERTYENVVALRAVNSLDGMTADWSRLPYEFLAQVSNDIINKVKGVNRVVYDISSKPPATIEWE